MQERRSHSSSREAGKQAGREGASGRSYAAFSQRYPRPAGRVCTFVDGGVCARSAAGAAPRRGPDGSSSPLIKLNEVGVEARSGGLAVNF